MPQRLRHWYFQSAENHAEIYVTKRLIIFPGQCGATVCIHSRAMHGCVRFGAAHERGVWRKRYKDGLSLSSDIPTAILSAPSLCKPYTMDTAQQADSSQPFGRPGGGQKFNTIINSPRNPKACLFCKERKLSCGGSGLRCDNCQSRDLACTNTPT